MCLIIKWWCPACEVFVDTREFQCRAGQDCRDRLLVRRPLERELMQDWNCYNEDCDYSLTSERAFHGQVYAARALSGEGEPTLAQHQPMDVDNGQNHISYEAEPATAAVTHPPHPDDTTSEYSTPPVEAPRYPSPPPPISNYHHTAHSSPPHHEVPRLRASSQPKDTTRRVNGGSSRKRRRTSPSPEPTHATDPETESEPDAPSPSTTASTIPHHLPLSHFHAFNPAHGTAATWNLTKKTSRTPKDHKVDFASLNPTLRNRIAALRRQNAAAYREGAEWSEGEKELLFLLKETLDFQTGNAMFGRDIYNVFFSYRTSTASQPHNMVEARANILRKQRGGGWWVQEERRPLLVLGMQPDGS
ncbi:hypothetical protein QBC34DRAFT_467635 [Podospora aff. communis PSN243]|uniref:Zinc finger PHD-type domain-containing protein n=1 Tax=Podospora aff. communis PSN243 TaxID=3040156 RepID=A0AAV9GJ53_9PEZI|nr:hypothetical protein QBC34DRAFT_467635 [Podospora aff. communis PSN243]